MQNKMKILDALNILKLQEPFTKEDIKRNYLMRCSENHPDKFSGSTKEIIEQQTIMMAEINNAYSTLRDNAIVDSSSINFDFNCFYDSDSQNAYRYAERDYTKETESQKASNAMHNFWYTCLAQQASGKYGLAIRLFEFGIELCHTKLYENSFSKYLFYRDLGTMLIDIGLFTQGFSFLKTGGANYYIAKSYFFINDYDNALFYWNKEMIQRTTAINSEGLIIQIAKCYFLKKDYEKCLEAIEGKEIIHGKNNTTTSLVSKRIAINRKGLLEEKLPKYLSEMLLYSIFAIYKNNSEKTVDRKFISSNFPITYKIFLKFNKKNISDIQSYKKNIDDILFLEKLTKKVGLKFTIKENICLDYSNAEFYDIVKRIFDIDLANEQILSPAQLGIE